MKFKMVTLAVCFTLVTACTTVTSSATLIPETEKVFTASYDDVFSKSTQTLMALGWQVVSSSKEEGLIQARTPMTMLTWGDVVTVAVSKSDQQVRVELTSASNQQVDWGKNSANIKKFYQHLNTML